LHNYVVKNIELSSYSVSDLATDLGISERNLYRRVNDLMNMSVAEYIREVKLQRAHDLLTANKVKTISEAAIKVGFKSISHFSKLYREKFKVTE
jgi:AraC-like DNA-binding protein